GHVPCHQAGDGIGDQGGHDDDHPAHGGRPTFGEMRRRTVLADELTVVAVHQEPNEQRGAQQREHERGRARDEDGDHWPTPVPAVPPCWFSMSATAIRPAPLDVFTITTSPPRIISASIS